MITPSKPNSRRVSALNCALQTLSGEPLYIKKHRTLTVRTNGRVYLTKDKHYYSVRYTYIGNKVQMIYTEKLVHIYQIQQFIANRPVTAVTGF